VRRSEEAPGRQGPLASSARRRVSTMGPRSSPFGNHRLAVSHYPTTHWCCPSSSFASTTVPRLRLTIRATCAMATRQASCRLRPAEDGYRACQSKKGPPPKAAQERSREVPVEEPYAVHLVGGLLGFAAPAVGLDHLHGRQLEPALQANGTFLGAQCTGIRVPRSASPFP